MASRHAALLRPIEMRSATDVVYARLQEVILEGRFRPGEQLPSEPELSDALGVGRSTVREAKKVLADRGLIESRSRLGTFVVGPPSDSTRLPGLRSLLADPALPDLHESRQLVELGAIRLAVDRASGDDISDLYASLDQIEADIVKGNPDVWQRLVMFHRSLVRVAHNNVLLSIVDLLAHLLLAHHVPFYPSVAELNDEARSHRELVDLVAGCHPQAAADTMRAHLDAPEDLRRETLDRLRDGQ